MIRSVASIVAALQAVAPSFGPKEDAARVLAQLGQRYSLDPFTLVAVAERESRWTPAAVGALDERGITQIMPTNYAVCRGAPRSDACSLLKVRLGAWDHNLREAAKLMHFQREWCHTKVGSRLAKFWMQEFQGYRGTCGHVLVKGKWRALVVPKGTREVLKRRAELAARF